jgi:predicted metal-dependent HD superfamily phosphohydrolase
VGLAERWQDLADRVGIAPERAAPVGRHLLDAYGDPARSYHDLRHLDEVLDHVDELAPLARRPDLVRLAAWFHDETYAGAPTDEDDSARSAGRLLADAGLPADDVAEVGRLVRLTATHDPAPGDDDGAVLCDADLAVLARDPDGYRAYAEDVRREYAHVPDDAFAAGRAAVLAALLAAPTLFRTEEGRRRWEDRARANVEAEVARLRAGG